MYRKVYVTTSLVLTLFLIAGCHTNKKSMKMDGPRKIEILFLGHNSEHHNAAAYMPILAAALSKQGIEFTYTADPNDLNEENLSKYDGLVIYANHDEITPGQEKALLDFVEAGNGFIPLHAASFCFRDSPEYVDMVGGQFLRHDTATFVAKITDAAHPVMEGVKEFSTWDETYVHDKIADDITILMERVEGDHHEPWTWVKNYGKGRVFYTAYGHDERTWNNPGFQKLVENGIVWAVGDPVRSQWQEFMAAMPKPAYSDKPNIPNYEKRDPKPKYQEPLSPEESKKLIQVPAEFDLELFASEPNVINPIAMDWDERGRLWVIETVDYPNTVRKEDGVGDDRIKICEDTDGDGKADKFTVFAENLNIPTSMVFANGGVIVSQAPEFLFLKDTDGDDKADIRNEIVHGWGVYDTHAGPSNLKYGLDNHIWGTVGYSGFEGTIAGKDMKFSQGVYRFTPDVSDFEYITQTSNNTWGLGFTETFDVFASTANNTHSVYVGIPNYYFDGVDGIPATGSMKIDGHYAMHPTTFNVRQVDVFGGFTAAAGHNFYTARAYPEKYWNSMALVCEPTGHLLHMAMIEKDGAGFKEKDGWNLLSSADEWVSPVEAKVGPDGAVWVLDWYNFIVQHNPTPREDFGGYNAENGEGNAYVNPLRDQTHGRIWRVVYKEAEPYEPIQLSMDDPEGLVAALKNDNMFWRTTAQRLLVERGNDDVLESLNDLVNSKTKDELGMNTAAIHALWTIKGLGAFDGDNNEAYQVAVAALNHPAAGVRKAAIQVLPRTAWANQALMQSDVIHDADPHTRLTALLALSEMKTSAKMGELLYNLGSDEAIQNDNWLSKALYCAAAHHREGYMNAYLSDHPNYEIERAKLAAMVTWEKTGFADADWKTISLPNFFERVGLNIDGQLQFRNVVNVPGNMAGKEAKISLGRIDESDETWVNGQKVGGIKDDPSKDRVYTIPAGVLQVGENTIAIQVEDNRGWGGFGGKPEEMFIQVNGSKIPLAGDWKYKINKTYDDASQSLFTAEASIGDAFMDQYFGKAVETPVPVAQAEPTGEKPMVITIKTVPNQMKYDLTEIVVEAGKTVRILFENPDFMQHNLLILQQGTLQEVGAAADKLAADPKGAEKNYVPEIPQVLHATTLVNPGETFTLTFQAPDEAGDYPFICTFPGHWRLMQGVMKVTGSGTAI